MIDPEDVKLCNCADCGRELLGESMRDLEIPTEVPHVKGRILGRPYCRSCLKIKRTAIRVASWLNGMLEPDPSGENAVRELEDADEGIG